jgi:F-type H+-transporting ATPase subunit gamma
MFKFVLALVCTIYAESFLTHDDLENNDAIAAERVLASLMFAQQPLPLKSISSQGRARPSVQMAGVKELQIRLAATEKTAKITSTMKLVAAAKAQKAAELAVATKPFASALQDALIGLVDRIGSDTAGIPLLEKRPVKKVGLVVILGDRGLCGGYNSKIIKKTEDRIKELSGKGIDAELFIVGNKGKTYFGRRPTPIKKDANCGSAPGSTEVEDITQALVSAFSKAEVDRVEMIYTSFTSMVVQVTSIRTLIPFGVSDDGIEMEDDEIKLLTSKDGELSVETVGTGSSPEFLEGETLIDEEPSAILDELLPLYLNANVKTAWNNGIASELGARYTAMNAATDNANDLKEKLDQQINRLRQGKISQEIAEIVAGGMV